MLYVRGTTTTPINGATVASLAQATAAITTQDTDLELWDQVDLALTMNVSVTNLTPWALYLIPDTADDATSPTPTIPPPSIYLVAQWPCASGTAAQLFTAHGIALPPGEFTYVLYNGTPQASSASSVTLHRRPYHVA